MDKKYNGCSMIYRKKNLRICNMFILLSCIMTWIFFETKVLKTVLKLTLFEKFMPPQCEKCTEGLVYNTILKCISNLLVILSSGFDYKFYFLYMKVFVAISLLSFRKTYKRNLHSFLNQKRLYHSLLMIF